METVMSNEAVAVPSPGSGNGEILSTPVTSLDITNFYN
jgi:hypothetical protein